MNRALPILILSVGTLLSVGSAYGVNVMLGVFIAVEGEVASAPVVSTGRPAPRAPMPRALSADKYLDGIMRRNLFDVDIIATWNPNPTADKGPIGPTDLNVKLVGTVVAVPAELSSAVIRHEEKGYSRGYSVGDWLEDREVIKIEKKRVTLKRKDGQIEVLTIDDSISAPPTSSTSTPSSSEDEAVQETGDNKFAVSKELFDKYINDLEGISRMGRALLHRGPDGEFDGYRLSAIRRNTLADQLGIKNGDIIHSVNGQPLNSVQSAMGAYNTMKTESNFCFEITRRGSPVELCYDVR
ncbi:MAG TPA: hypothetical protein ENK18_08930 [Deltaproteobacteria bacterium]|nr:hypothetical protein [Deltaproteobacteria bacterium]